MRRRRDTSLAFAHQNMAIVYTEQGKVAQGKMEIRRALELAPWLSLQGFSATRHYQNEKDLARFVGALRTAGLPE